jgi:hypothetical protein
MCFLVFKEKKKILEGIWGGAAEFQFDVLNNMAVEHSLTILELAALVPLGTLMLVRQHRLGGDRTIGRRLGRLLTLAGFEDIQMDLVSWIDSSSINHIQQ